MTKHLISFPSEAMVLTAGAFPMVAVACRCEQELREFMFDPAKLGAGGRHRYGARLRRMRSSTGSSAAGGWNGWPVMASKARM